LQETSGVYIHTYAHTEHTTVYTHTPLVYIYTYDTWCVRAHCDVCIHMYIYTRGVVCEYEYARTYILWFVYIYMYTHMMYHDVTVVIQWRYALSNSTLQQHTTITGHSRHVTQSAHNLLLTCRLPNCSCVLVRMSSTITRDSEFTITFTGNTA